MQIVECNVHFAPRSARARVPIQFAFGTLAVIQFVHYQSRSHCFLCARSCVPVNVCVSLCVCVTQS